MVMREREKGVDMSSFGLNGPFQPAGNEWNTTHFGLSAGYGLAQPQGYNIANPFTFFSQGGALAHTRPAGPSVLPGTQTYDRRMAIEQASAEVTAGALRNALIANDQKLTNYAKQAAIEVYKNPNSSLLRSFHVNMGQLTLDQVQTAMEYRQKALESKLYDNELDYQTYVDNVIAQNPGDARVNQLVALQESRQNIFDNQMSLLRQSGEISKQYVTNNPDSPFGLQLLQRQQVLNTQYNLFGKQGLELNNQSVALLKAIQGDDFELSGIPDPYSSELLNTALDARQLTRLLNDRLQLNFVNQGRLGTQKLIQNLTASGRNATQQQLQTLQSLKFNYQRILGDGLLAEDALDYSNDIDAIYGNSPYLKGSQANDIAARSLLVQENRQQLAQLQYGLLTATAGLPDSDPAAQQAQQRLAQFGQYQQSLNQYQQQLNRFLP